MSKIFNLPDLGEGLPDAEIREWHVKAGDKVKIDQPLVSMETAKAVVEVPSPQDGVIEKLYGSPNDVIITGHPLVAFADESSRQDEGTVVGHIESSGQTVSDDFIVGAASDNGSAQKIKATPAVRNLARQLNVDLSKVKATGPHGVITAADVEAFKADGRVAASANTKGFEPLRGVRRAMLQSMVQSHEEIVPVSIFDDADIDAWKPNSDITVRLIQAMIDACKKEPSLNAYYDHLQAARQLHPEVNLGLAMDMPEGLFVPVIHHAEKLSASELRQWIERLKKEVQARNTPPEMFKSATITLSNFGKFAGRYASPIIVPPMVAILGVGRLHEAVVAIDGKPAVHKILPLSLTFDHRAVTGGEATRFLAAVMESLAQPEV